MYSTEQESSTGVQWVHAGARWGGRGAGHSVTSVMGGTSQRPLLASRRDVIYTNMGIPAVTDIQPDEINSIHLSITLATGFVTSMLPVGSQ